MSKFQIDPKTQMVIMFLVGLIGFLGTNALPADVPVNVTKVIHDWSLWLTSLYNLVIGPLMMAYSNSNPGPLAPQDSPEVVKATAIAAAKGA